MFFITSVPYYLKSSTLLQVLHDILLHVEGAQGLQGSGPTRAVTDRRIPFERSQIFAARYHRVRHPQVVVNVPHFFHSGRGKKDDERHELGAAAQELERLRGGVEDAGSTLVDDGAD